MKKEENFESQQAKLPGKILLSIATSTKWNNQQYQLNVSKIKDDHAK